VNLERLWSRASQSPRPSRPAQSHLNRTTRQLRTTRPIMLASSLPSVDVNYTDNRERYFPYAIPSSSHAFSHHLSRSPEHRQRDAYHDLTAQEPYGQRHTRCQQRSPREQQRGGKQHDEKSVAPARRLRVRCLAFQ